MQLGLRITLCTETRSPTLGRETPAPTAATSPVGSTPSTCGKGGLRRYSPLRTAMSRVTLTETAWTFTRTSRSGRRRRDVFELQHVGAPELAQHDRFQRPSRCEQ